jgi:hypothetical protein
MSAIVAIILFLVSGFVAWTIWLNIRGRRYERRLSRERGSQTESEFVSLFQTEAEQYAAKLLYPRIESLTFTKQLPLRADDSLTNEPLSIVPDDLTFEIEELFAESGMCFSLNPDAADALSKARTVGELVARIAVFVEQQILTREAD